MKVRLLICCMLIFAFLPVNGSLASPSIDRDQDGVNIDDVVFHISQSPLLSIPEINDLLMLIDFKHAPTAIQIASGIISIVAPNVDETSLTLPSVPSGFNIEIISSSNEEVIRTDGVVVPPLEGIDVVLELKVTRTFNNTSANTVGITVTVPARTSNKNVAAAVSGGVATASSSSSGFLAEYAINGDRKGNDWGASGGWENSSTGSPQWLQVTFYSQGLISEKSINEINVFTIQENYHEPIEPTLETSSSSSYGLTTFTVQYLDDMGDSDAENDIWVTVTDGDVTGNTMAWRQFKFEAVITKSIRIMNTNGVDGKSRVTQLEAWSTIE
jgi:hypothetical protein